MDILQEICAKKKEHIEYRKSICSLDNLKYKIDKVFLPSGFLRRMKRSNAPALIAEVKKASPSKGIIRRDFNPVEIAKIYESAGATCISVLTDEPYFQGSDTFVNAIKNKVDLPILRKDFMLDPYQIYESRALGADCVLLIMAALDDRQALELYETAVSLHLDVLVEVHNLKELERALLLNPMMIGVNNRNLKTMDIDINTSYDLLAHIPDNIYKISESGISDNKTIKNLHRAGFQGFLVGETLMREENIANAVHKLLDTKGELS